MWRGPRSGMSAGGPAWCWAEAVARQVSRPRGSARPAHSRAADSALWHYSSAIFEVLVIPTRVPEATPEEVVRAQFWVR